jgi:hypothetical protein
VAELGLGMNSMELIPFCAARLLDCQKLLSTSFAWLRSPKITFRADVTMCVFITAVPITKLFARGGVKN